MTPQEIHQVFLRAAIQCAEQGATAREMADYLKNAASGMDVNAAFAMSNDRLICNLRLELIE